MVMKILIVNDDGMHAAQLVSLIKWCQKLGDVTTAVPKFEQSGRSHSIELLKPFEAKEVELEPGTTIRRFLLEAADLFMQQRRP